MLKCQLLCAENTRQYTDFSEYILQAERLTYLGVAIQGSTESLVGSHPPSTTPLAKLPLPPSQPVLPGGFNGSTPVNPPVLCPHNPPGMDPPGKSTDDNEPPPPPPAALTAAQQLVDQLKVLLSGQLSQQCESLQVCAHTL